MISSKFPQTISMPSFLLIIEKVYLLQYFFAKYWNIFSPRIKCDPFLSVARILIFDGVIFLKRPMSTAYNILEML